MDNEYFYKNELIKALAQKYNMEPYMVKMMMVAKNWNLVQVEQALQKALE